LKAKSLYAQLLVCTKNKPGIARCNPLFLLLHQVIMRLEELDTANPGNNKTKQKIEPGNSWLKNPKPEIGT